MIIFKKQSGFTLLEILLVVGIISILAGIAIIAINPGRQLAQARNMERVSDLKQINNALQQYFIDNQEYPAGLSGTLTEICDTGMSSSSQENQCTNLVDLSALVPTYLAAIPVDPQVSSANSSSTGYKVIKYSSTGKVGLKAESAEQGETISVGIPLTYTVTYNGNNNTSGTVPIDDQEYQSGETVTVLGNTGSLTRDGFIFTKWNTASNGAGTDRSAGSTFVINSDVNLYAKWEGVVFCGGDVMLCNGEWIYRTPPLCEFNCPGGGGGL